MTLRHRNRPEEERPAHEASGVPAEDAAAQGAQAQALLNAGSAIIKDALSHDSEAFLAANRQQGGE